MKIRALSPSDRPWVVDLLQEHWGSVRIVSRGRVHEAADLPGFVALQGSRRAGLVTYDLRAGRCEIVSLNSLHPGHGIGSTLLAAVRQVAKGAGCSRLWLVTTNDNLHALGFYQRRGFLLWRIHRNAVADSRQLKPEIPLVSANGIPIRDEIELLMTLG
jgi:GNAT superfamily N-acetyltransferase